MVRFADYKRPTSMNPEPPISPITPTPKSSSRLWLEDLIVTGFGMASSGAVAYGSFYLARYHDFAIYTWMANAVIPIGSIICGFVAAIGYWVGSRLFNHKPTRLLLCNIVLVSVGTFFSIYHLEYTHSFYGGQRLEEVMSFPDYLTASIEHMTYKSSRSGEQATELGKWGWGAAGLQVLGFCLGGWAVYVMLAGTPFCANCSMYFRRVWARGTKWKDLSEMGQQYDQLGALLEGGHFETAVDQHAASGAKMYRAKGLLTMTHHQCPGCQENRLTLLAQKANGNHMATIASRVLVTRQQFHKSGAAAA